MQAVGGGDGPCARYHHSASIYRQQYLIVAGGKNFKGDELTDIWALDLNTLVWTHVADVGSTKFEHQACLYKDKLIVMGGSELQANTVNVLELSRIKFKSTVSRANTPPTTPVGNKQQAPPSAPELPLSPPLSPVLDTKTELPSQKEAVSKKQLVAAESQLATVRADLKRVQDLYDQLQAENLLVN